MWLNSLLLATVKNGGITREVIIATNITAEGETTADYTQQMLAPYDVKITRLARGVPVGGELEYMDQRTLAAAFKDRRTSVE